MDLAVVPLVAVLSLPTLLWFADQPWTVLGKDAPRYLFAGSEIVSGGGLDSLAGVSNYNGGHGPVFPALIGALILVLGRDTESLVWAMRLTALLNPILAYFLARRLSGPPLGPPAGLLAAAMLTLFGSNVRSTFVLNIDALLLTFTLLSLLALLAAVGGGGTSPALALLSGLLLGASVLTKETAVANLPIALLAVLLLDWSPRAAIWHYLGVVLVCLPWWAWRWSATGEVYLLDRLPSSLGLPVLVAAAILLGLAVAAYASGAADLFLAGERRRRWAGRFVVVAWAVSLSVLMLATTGAALAEASPETVGAYLAGILAPAAAVVPVLVVTAGYAVWMSFRRGGAWTLLGLVLLFQVPVCLFIVVMGWDPRQFLVAQALIFCVLAALVVDAAGAAWRGRGLPARLAGAAIAVTLVILVLAASVRTVQAMLPEDPAGALSEQHEVAPQASGMVGWMRENVQEGERVLVNTAQGNYLAYLDGGRHEWEFLKLDQEPCVSKPNIQTACDPEEGAISGIPPDAVWVQRKEGCEVISLSMPNLMAQMRRTGADYVMITSSPKFPGILGLPTVLQRSGAFEIVRSGGSRGAGGVVLLKTTGRPAGAAPTLMNGDTVAGLGRCVEAQGRGYQGWLRSRFPDGILGVTVAG
ncbi:MAG TPA: glycosyltransferase family 39 protein [Rubrobacter sp.]|nr:glycosyltransferase family 39 protein [Rubrobacter sp.]